MIVEPQTLTPHSLYPYKSAQQEDQASQQNREKVLELVQFFSPTDLQWLRDLLDRLLDDDTLIESSYHYDEDEDDDDDGELLPENATLDEAIELYLGDKCSLGRAAELANVTRWDIMDVLKERNIPIMVDRHLSAEEIDELAEQLENQGVL